MHCYITVFFCNVRYIISRLPLRILEERSPRLHLIRRVLIFLRPDLPADWLCRNNRISDQKRFPNSRKSRKWGRIGVNLIRSVLKQDAKIILWWFYIHRSAETEMFDSYAKTDSVGHRKPILKWLMQIRHESRGTCTSARDNFDRSI